MVTFFADTRVDDYHYGFVGPIGSTAARVLDVSLEPGAGTEFGAGGDVLLPGRPASSGQPDPSTYNSPTVHRVQDRTRGHTQGV